MNPTDLVNWILKNKEWLFSGVGVALGAFLLTWVLKRFRVVAVAAPESKSASATHPHVVSTDKVLGMPPLLGVLDRPKRVPESITFGYKILQIPTLEEMGIPLSGFGMVRLNDQLRKKGLDACWIDRGDPLLTYDFRFFSCERRPFFSMFKDAIEHMTYTISSPISGLLLSTRDELTIDFLYGLQYQRCAERLVPIILVPNDEPPADTHAFYVYDRIARYLIDKFNVIPIRDPRNLRPERLPDWIDRSDHDTAKRYRGYLSALRERNEDRYRTFEIREITNSDRELINTVQHLRGRDFQLREKLVHIARKHGESI